jgi:hypothetical protein
MKKLCVYVCLAFFCVANTHAKTSAEEPEIVIELTGQPAITFPDIAVWQKNEQQLSRLFKGKDRTFVLYSISSVSSADTVLTAENGTKYLFVRYGQDDRDYRKFLFDEQERFLAAADNVETVLKLNRQYGINLGVNEADFATRFQDKTILTNVADFPNNRQYQVYQLTAKGTTSYFVFSDAKLQKIYPDENAYNEYMTSLSQKNKEWLSKRKAEEKTLAEKRQKEAAAKKANQIPRRKALVSGGTVTDQIYLPRARGVDPIPALTPSTVPAGTPVTKYNENGLPIY